jgi:hypothetical protein
MQEITINYSVADNCSAECKITSIVSNEAVNGLGDGNTAPDWEYIDNQHVRLRAERSGKRTGRLYTITITCTDASGNSVSRNVVVTVPKNRRSEKETGGVNSSARVLTTLPLPESLDAETKMSVYPNPVFGQLTVELINSNASKSELILVNSIGRIMETKSVAVNQKRQTILFNMKNYTPGIYLSKLTSKEGVKTKKIILQR